MTITAEQARELLDRATETDHWSYDHESGTVYTENSNAICDLISSDQDGFLLGAAPDLARTVIAQAEENARLREELATARDRALEEVMDAIGLVDGKGASQCRYRVRALKGAKP